MTILVTGATGFVGRRLMTALRERFPQTPITALVRTAPGPGALPQGVAVVTGDLADARSLAAAVKGADAVVHLAGVVKPHAGESAAMRAVNAEGTRALYEAALNAGTRRFVHLSSAAVYGAPRGARPFAEDSEQRPLSPYGRSKLEAEKVLLATHPGDASLVILRPPGIYGAGSAVEAPMYRTALARPVTVELAGGVVVHPTHVSDVTGAILAILDETPAGVSIFNVGGERPILVQDLHALAYEIGVGRRPLRVVLPTYLAGPMGAAAASVLKLAGRPVGALASAGRGERLNAAVDDGRFRDRYPVVGIKPLVEGLREHIDWARAQGLLQRP